MNEQQYLKKHFGLVSSSAKFCDTHQAAAVHRERTNRKSRREQQMATVMMSVRMREQIVRALDLRYTHTHTTHQYERFFPIDCRSDILPGLSLILLSFVK